MMYKIVLYSSVISTSNIAATGRGILAKYYTERSIVPLGYSYDICCYNGQWLSSLSISMVVLGDNPHSDLLSTFL